MVASGRTRDAEAAVESEWGDKGNSDERGLTAGTDYLVDETHTKAFNGLLLERLELQRERSKGRARRLRGHFWWDEAL